MVHSKAVKNKGRGRPRKYADDAERLNSFRRRKQAAGSRLDIYISSSASWRLKILTEAWDCSRSQAVERLLLEADRRYKDIIFKEGENRDLPEKTK